MLDSKERTRATAALYLVTTLANARIRAKGSARGPCRALLPRVTSLSLFRVFIFEISAARARRHAVSRRSNATPRKCTLLRRLLRAEGSRARAESVHYYSSSACDVRHGAGWLASYEILRNVARRGERARGGIVGQYQLRRSLICASGERERKERKSISEFFGERANEHELYGCSEEKCPHFLPAL